MAQSPYLSKELKEYLTHHQIEDKINKAINEMLRQRPEDPYGTLVNLLGEECSQKISLAGIKAIEVFSNEFRPIIKLDCSFRFKMATNDGFSQIFSLGDENNTQVIYDQDKPERFEGKGMQKACELVNSKVAQLFNETDCNDSKKVDDILKSFLENNEGLGINITLPLSILINKATASLLKTPLYKKLNSAYFATEDFRGKVPDIFMCILQGSKVNASKCKPARFYYILPADKTALEKTTLARNLALGVRKVISSGKLGENGVKQLTDCSFICPYDTINDNLKMLDEVIAQNGVKDVVKIGIEWAAENLYQAAQAKYELENPNPKNWLDANQLIDFYLKLCTDRPSIAYMEDPLVPDNPDAWIALKTKFQGKNVKFGSRKLYRNLESAKKVLESIKADGSDMTQEQIDQANTKKVHLDYAVLRYGDFPTIGSLYQLSTYLLSRSPSMNIVIQDNYSETEDTFLIDVGASFNKSTLLLGPPLKSERLSKFNRIIQLEQLTK